MKIYAGSRENGKTTKLLRYFVGDPNGVFVVTDAGAKAGILARIQELLPETDPKFHRKRVVTVRMLQNEIDLTGKNIYCDNGELVLAALLQQLTDGNLIAMTVTASGPRSTAPVDPARIPSEQFAEQFPVESEESSRLQEGSDVQKMYRTVEVDQSILSPASVPQTAVRV